MKKNKRSKLFVDLAIAWKSNSFHKAKLKLTGIYLSILAIILVGFSSLLFFHVERRLSSIPHIPELEAQKIIQKTFPNQTIIETEFEDGEYTFTLSNGQESKVDAFSQKIVDEDARGFHYTFLHEFGDVLTFMALLTLIVSGVLSYFLASKTLKPIRENMEKQKQFVANAAHELRNPLSTIQLTSESMMRLSKFPASDTKEAFQDIFSESQRLITITENLLVLDGRKKSEETISLSIKDIIEYVAKILSPLAKKKNINIDLKLKSFILKGKQKDFEHIFYNLLHNAIKFSKAGGKINISLNEEGVFSIEDFGIGISNDKIPHIFDRFYKADTGRQFFEESGAGLGLAIVKELLDMYGSDIFVESKDVEGTKITIHF